MLSSRTAVLQEYLTQNTTLALVETVACRTFNPSIIGSSTSTPPHCYSRRVTCPICNSDNLIGSKANMLHNFNLVSGPVTAPLTSASRPQPGAVCILTDLQSNKPASTSPDFSCGFVWGGVGRVCGWGGVWVWVGPGRGVLSGCAVCVGGWGGLWAVVCPPRRCV